jgi:hypothetical protein
MADNNSAAGIKTKKSSRHVNAAAHQIDMEKLQRQLAVETAPVARRVIRPVEPERNVYAGRRRADTEDNVEYPPRTRSQYPDRRAIQEGPSQYSSRDAYQERSNENPEPLNPKPFNDMNIGAMDEPPVQFEERDQYSMMDEPQDFNDLMQE